MEDYNFIHESYIIDENNICYLCKLPIPLNIFRGSIDGACNKLALQFDHVIPKYNGGDNSKNNLKPTHRYCNGSKNKNIWREEKKVQAIKIIAKLLNEPLDESWTPLKNNNTCIIKNCEKIARSGNHWLYCLKHARENNENIRAKECSISNCSKRARKSNYCQTHYKEFFNEHINKCRYENCEKQIQYFIGGKYCQKHSRKLGLITKEIEPGIKEKASHTRLHKNTPSQSCFWCVEMENRINYFNEAKILLEIKDKDLAIKSIGKIYKISLRAGKCLKDKSENNHNANCAYCFYINNCHEYYKS